MNGRPLKPEEKALLSALLIRNPAAAAILLQLDRYLVKDMADGGMGSVRVVGSDDRRMGGTVAEIELTDSDGMPLVITVIKDESGDLYEIDIWKVDFSPLKTYPTVNR